MSTEFNYFASCPPGAEPLLAEELEGLGIAAVQAKAGVTFTGPLVAGYRACLWSRIANRVLLGLLRTTAANPDALYEAIASIPWQEHFSPRETFKIRAVLAQSNIGHSLFAAQKIKDAIVDQFRAHSDQRPSVDLVNPDIQIHAYIFRDKLWLYLDLAGESLHRRHYRGPTTAAPLKENIAAAMLQFAGWKNIAATGGGFIDPMCGSGVLAIEAALIAKNCAPGLKRENFGFMRWQGHDAALWDSLIDDAKSQQKPIDHVIAFASDSDPRAIDAAKLNAESAGVSDLVRIEVKPMEHLSAPSGFFGGLMACNPPYGERIGAEEGLGALYANLGKVLKASIPAWHAVILTGGQQWLHRLRIPAERKLDIKNGPLDLTMACFAPRADLPAQPQEKHEPPPVSNSAFFDRIKKNLKHLKRWREKNNISCFRLYDADIPEFGFAVDIYESEKTWVVLQEYAPPASVDPEKAAQRLAIASGDLADLMEIPSTQVIVKQRRRQSEDQYGAENDSAEMIEVQEGGLKFLVNFKDYLDGGLFLDHRDIRARIREESGGKRFLNLFAYTASASIYAASGGAASTESVDRSNSYLDWAEKNLKLNGYSNDQHILTRADCLPWLATAGNKKEHRFDLIFADVPTYSNSKSARRDFDAQRDHVELISAAMRLLSEHGVLYFSTHFKRFKLDSNGLRDFKVEDISRSSLPFDFRRNPRIRYCWRITHTS